MSESLSTDALRRYTNLASTISILQTRQITLLSPTNWDDRNDRHFMTAYKTCKNLETLTAICFTGNLDTYHHWRVFSPYSDGICIVFKRAALLETFKGKPGVSQGDVKYRRIEELSHDEPTVEDLPFIKRMPYEPESEYRVIYEHPTDKAEFKKFDIALDSIDSIIFSPWTHISHVEPIKKTLKKIRGCKDIRMFGSTVVENEQWKSAADKLSAKVQKKNAR